VGRAGTGPRGDCTATGETFTYASATEQDLRVGRPPKSRILYVSLVPSFCRQHRFALKVPMSIGEAHSAEVHLT
jgi:hypothetical protein